MIKDRLLKIKVIEYYLRRYWYPQMEVNVLSKNRFSEVPKLITDVDVLGLYPEVTGNLKLILGDCKTLKGQSPITRSLWMKGLMDYFNAEKAIIILTKNIEKEHQLTSNYLNVHLLSDSDFEIYAKATSDTIIDLNSALAVDTHWDEFFEIEKKFPSLVSLCAFSRTMFWNEPQNTNRLRKAIGLLKSLKGELNPGNTYHLSLVLNHFSLIAISLNEIILQIFNRYAAPKSKEELDNDLKVIIYGGISNYDFLNEVRKRFAATAGGVGDKDLALPEWELFLEFIRATFESPIAFNLIPLFLKETAFQFLSTSTPYDYKETIASKNPYIKVYSYRLSDYLCKACQLPPEFIEIFSKSFGY